MAYCGHFDRLSVCPRLSWERVDRFGLHCFQMTEIVLGKYRKSRDKLGYVTSYLSGTISDTAVIFRWYPSESGSQFFYCNKFYGTFLWQKFLSTFFATFSFGISREHGSLWVRKSTYEAYGRSAILGIYMKSRLFRLDTQGQITCHTHILFSRIYKT